MTQKERCVVLVTGGAGFLGQHIVGLLQERADHVTDIKVLDVTPYRNKLDYESKKPVEHILGSVTDTSLVNKACQGVDCVMHVASIVDTSLLPDKELSHKINVEGTRNVIEACKKNGVKRLIYCSSIEVVVGKQNVYCGTEDNTRITTEHHFPVYGASKVEAETMVLQANSDQLQTVSLRPSVLYGELEWRSLGRVTNTYMARKLGTYIRFDCHNGIADHVYVGNVAWGFICAEKTLREQKTGSNVCGASYFIVDDSPHKSITDFMDYMFLEIGLKPIKPKLPIWMALLPLYIFYAILSIVSLVYKVNLNVGIDSFTSIQRVYIFKYDKAQTAIGYRPLFSYDEAKARTVRFLKTILNDK